MSAGFVLSPQAERDIDDIAGYITGGSAEVALSRCNAMGHGFRAQCIEGPIQSRGAAKECGQGRQPLD